MLNMTDKHLEYVQRCIKKYGSNSIRKVYWYATMQHPRSGVRLTKTEVAMLARISPKVVFRLLEDENYESLDQSV